MRQHNSYCVQRAEDRTKWICCEDCPVGAYEEGVAAAKDDLEEQRKLNGELAELAESHKHIQLGLVAELTIANNMVLNWRAGEDCCDKRDAALAENARLHALVHDYSEALIEAAGLIRKYGWGWEVDARRLEVLADTGQPKGKP